MIGLLPGQSQRLCFFFFASFSLICLPLKIFLSHLVLIRGSKTHDVAARRVIHRVAVASAIRIRDALARVLTLLQVFKNPAFVCLALLLFVLNPARRIEDEEEE